MPQIRLISDGTNRLFQADTVCVAVADYGLNAAVRSLSFAIVSSEQGQDDRLFRDWF
jgi:hypothetical protein